MSDAAQPASHARRPRSEAGRLLLVLLAAWGLAMVVPDGARLLWPLGSFGFAADNDGRVLDVRGPFARPADSPAWRASLRVGDRLDLAAMRCRPVATLRCATAQAALGGLRLVMVGRRGELIVRPAAGGPSRRIALFAEQRPFSWWVMAVTPLCLLAAVAVVLAAAWLVWTRPSAMSWGFFLYVVWFNPGSSDEYYSLLQQWPAALLAQSLVGAAAQGAGYAGFLLFALRAPRDLPSPGWSGLERAIPAIGAFLALLLVASFANLLGIPTEGVTRLGSLAGVGVALSALGVLLARRPTVSPSDNQRLWWVIWGCLIGLPAFVIAEIGQGTSLFSVTDAAPEEVWGLVRLLNGVLCLFVFEAVRRPRVVSVAVPLRRVTVLGLILSLPALLLHEQVTRAREWLLRFVHLPQWAWLAIAVLALFLISRLHEGGVHLVDRLIRLPLRRGVEALNRRIVGAGGLAEAEEALADGAARMFRLTAAILFRHEEAGFAYVGGHGWDGASNPTLSISEPGPGEPWRPFEIDAEMAQNNGWPEGPARPIYATPVADRWRCYAVVLWGCHTSGADLNQEERAVLTRLADAAAAVYGKLDNDRLRRRVAELEKRLAAIGAEPAPAQG